MKACKLEFPAFKSFQLYIFLNLNAFTLNIKIPILIFLNFNAYKLEFPKIECLKASKNEFSRTWKLSIFILPQLESFKYWIYEHESFHTWVFNKLKASKFKFSEKLITWIPQNLKTQKNYCPSTWKLLLLNSLETESSFTQYQVSNTGFLELQILQTCISWTWEIDRFIIWIPQDFKTKKKIYCASPWKLPNINSSYLESLQFFQFRSSYTQDQAAFMNFLELKSFNPWILWNRELWKLKAWTIQNLKSSKLDLDVNWKLPKWNSSVI